MAGQPLIIIVITTTVLMAVICYYVANIEKASDRLERYNRIKSVVENNMEAAVFDSLVRIVGSAKYAKDIAARTKNPDIKEKFQKLEEDKDCTINYALSLEKIGNSTVKTYLVSETQAKALKLLSAEDKMLTITAESERTACNTTLASYKATDLFNSFTATYVVIDMSNTLTAAISIHKMDHTRKCDYVQIGKITKDVTQDSLEGGNPFAFHNSIESADRNLYIDFKESPLLSETYELVIVLREATSGDKYLARLVQKILSYISVYVLTLCNIAMMAMFLLVKPDLMMKLILVLQLFIFYTIHIGSTVTTAGMLVLAPMYVVYTILQMIAWIVYPKYIA